DESDIVAESIEVGRLVADCLFELRIEFRGFAPDRGAERAELDRHHHAIRDFRAADTREEGRRHDRLAEHKMDIESELLELLEDQDRRPAKRAAVEQLRVGGADACELRVEIGVFGGKRLSRYDLEAKLRRELLHGGDLRLAERVSAIEHRNA